MLKYYGENSDGSFKLFQLDHPDSPPVYGQTKVQQSLWQNIMNFSEEGFNNKFILLIGPNGSSKSSIVKNSLRDLKIILKLMKENFIALAGYSLLKLISKGHWA